MRSRGFRPVLSAPPLLNAPFSLFVQLLTGMQQSVRPGDGGVTINVDVAHTTVYEPLPLADFLKNALNMRDSRGLERLQHGQFMQAKGLLMHKEVWLFLQQRLLCAK